MKRILVTGATGNIGSEVVLYLSTLSKESEIIAAVRDVERAKREFENLPSVKFRHFDFENEATFSSALHTIDTLFLLRPPQISKVDKFFEPLLRSARDSGIRKIVFLSVQGAEKSKFIPHNKIEKLIKSHGFDYIFVRPSYFMQNLTTTLLPEIVKNRTITLPAGSAKFNWVDVKNIGEASAVLINSFDSYRNNVFEVTGTENRDFEEVTALIGKVTGLEIKYHSLNPISFYFKKRKEGLPSDLTLVMAMIHFLQRFQKEPKVSHSYGMLTGKKPTSLLAFITREKEKFI